MESPRSSRRQLTRSSAGDPLSPRAIFYNINERPVDDISIELFYKPHTLTLLFISIIVVFYIAFTRDESRGPEENIWAGFCCVIFFFLVISSIAFPNGPFTRPHPIVWRVVFGLSVLYLMGLLFLLFQTLKDVKTIVYWFYPDLKSFHIDSEKEYGINCSDISYERVKSHLDVFAWGHFLGWAMKAILVRHYGICWAISVTWEMTEMVFAHLLPNFLECWWDALILDVLVCNGLGIYVGMKICEKLEMRTYNWEAFKEIKSTTGKLRRAVLQFTPASWMQVRWMDPACTWSRIIAVTELVIFWQVTELNTFFLKHIFEVPPAHSLSIGRLGLIGLIVAPSLRQFYCYTTDARCKRVGTQCWVFGAIMMTESLICVKFGIELFARTQIQNIVAWLFIMFSMSLICVLYCAYRARAQERRRQRDAFGHQPSESEYEDEAKSGSEANSSGTGFTRGHIRTRSLNDNGFSNSTGLSSSGLIRRTVGVVDGSG